MESNVPPKAALDLRAKLKNVQPKDVEVTHTHKVAAVAFSAQGTKLACATSGGSVMVLDVDQLGSGSRGGMTEIRLPKAYISGISWNPTDDTQIAVVQDEPCFRIGDTVKKGPTFEEKPKGALNYYGVKWSPDGRYVLCHAGVSGSEEVLELHDVARRKGRMWKTKAFTKGYEILDMAWSADSQYVFLTGQITNLSGNNIGFVELYQMNFKSDRSVLGDKIWSKATHSATISCIRLDLPHRRMALGSFDGLVSLWDMDAMACYKCADRCLTSVRAIDLAPNGSAVIVGSDDPTIDIVDMQTGMQIATFDKDGRRTDRNDRAGGEDGGNTFVAWCPNKNLFAWSHEDSRNVRFVEYA